MMKIFLMALIPGALIHWVGIGKENLWDLLSQGRILEIFNVLLGWAIVSIPIWIYGLIVEATGPHFIKKGD